MSRSNHTKYSDNYIYTIFDQVGQSSNRPQRFTERQTRHPHDSTRMKPSSHAHDEHDTCQCETKIKDNHTKLDKHSYTSPDKYKGNTNDFSKHENIQGTSTNYSPVSYTHESDSIERHKRNASNASTHSCQTRHRGSGAKHTYEANGFENFGVDKYNKDAEMHTSPISRGDAKRYQEANSTDYESEGKFKSKSQYTYDREASSTEPHLKHTYTSNTFDQRRTRNSSEPVRSNSQLNGMDKSSLRYQAKNYTTIEKHGSSTDSEFYERQRFEGEIRNIRNSTASKAYSRQEEKLPQQTNYNDIHDSHLGSTHKSHLYYRFRENEDSISTRDYREKLRENGQRKETVIDRLLTDKYNSDKVKAREKFKKINDRLEFEKQETERRSNELTKQITEENQNYLSASEREIHEQQLCKGEEKDQRILTILETYSSREKPHKHVTDYGIHGSQGGTTDNSPPSYRFSDDENSISPLDYSDKSRENGQQKKMCAELPATDTYNSDNQKDSEIEKQKKMDELKKLETERREKLRECEQKKKTAVDRPVTDTFTKSKEKDIEMEMLKKMNDRLNLEKQKAEESDKEKDRKLEKLKKMYERLKLEKQETERRSNELTKFMSRQMKRSNHFENCNDDFSSSRVAETFRSLYERDWVKLCKWISQNFRTIPEIKIIQYLSHLLKSCYKECIIMADNQIRQFLLLGDNDAIPKHEEHPELFELRKQYTLSDGTRKQARKIVKDKIKIAECLSIFNIEISDHGFLEKVGTFLEEFIDTCWLMTVLEPAISLNFDVVGKMYSDFVDHFSVYSLKKSVDDPTRTEGTVYEVVWPCVQLKFTKELYKKGDVILIKKNTKDKDTQT